MQFISVIDYLEAPLATCILNPLVISTGGCGITGPAGSYRSPGTKGKQWYILLHDLIPWKWWARNSSLLCHPVTNNHCHLTPWLVDYNARSLYTHDIYFFFFSLEPKRASCRPLILVSFHCVNVAIVAGRFAHSLMVLMLLT